ncbi:MAG: ABC transporter ATP-binding protein [Dehalococcoidia bacterium]|nr:ABC transporter ATP-binding protein [Dehalococcoidia bacterium]
MTGLNVSTAKQVEGTGATAQSAVFELSQVSKEFRVGARLWPWGGATLRAVDDVTLRIDPGECFGIVGESGCGKSTLAKLLLLLEPISSGRLAFHGQDVRSFSRRDVRRFRRKVQAVLQDPYSSLNPRMSISSIISEPMEALGVGNRKEREERVCTLMEQVGLNPDFRRRFPHQFSGGQQQRVAIARALSVEPEVLVLDEPTSALDVSVRTQIIRLLLDIKSKYSLTMVFISHDLAVVEQISDRVGVMYAGEVVETGQAKDVIRTASHPYTQVLTAAVPSPDPDERPPTRLLLDGEIPSPLNLPPGCRFHPRCSRALPQCAADRPQLTLIEASREAACHLFVPSAPPSPGANGKVAKVS